MKEKIKKEVIDKVNTYLKGKYIYINAPYPNEEYGTNVVTKEVLREALNLAFDETYELCNKNQK